MNLNFQVRTHSRLKRFKCTHFALSLHDIQRAAAVLVDLNRLGSWYIHLKLLCEMTSSSVPPQRHIYNLFDILKKRTKQFC